MTLELRQRIVSGVVMAAIFLTALTIGGWVFALLIAGVSCAVWLEWANMSLDGTDDRIVMVGLLAIGALTLALLSLTGLPLLTSIVAIFAVTSGLFLSWQKATQSIGGLFYAGGFLVAMVMLRGDIGFTAGLIAVLFLCAVVWATDIGAYFSGRYFGGPKLAPAISPNKTISGAVGGVLAAVVSAYIVEIAAGLSDLGTLAFIAFLGSIVSQSGDLFESYKKRIAGIKDSSNVIPGHGGFMDRIDGLVFAAIFLWLVCSLNGYWDRPALAFFS